MPESVEKYREHVERLRRREPGTVEAFVEEYGPFLRRSIRNRIRRASLQPLVDSVDVCQSVFASFIHRLSAGQFDIESEDGMRKLLYGIARNKFLMIQRREFTLKRCRKKTQSITSLPSDTLQHNHSADLDTQDLLSTVTERLSPDESLLFKYRSVGMSWADIAARVNESPQAVRQRLSRAVKRISIELGIDDES